MRVGLQPWGCLLVLVALVGPAMGDTQQTTATQTPAMATPHSETETLQTRAGYWGLEVSEYQRYQRLIAGPLGTWNPALDPLLALGMFADSPQEEARYAERYAQQEFELTERALQFQRAYRTAFARLYPDAALLDHQRLAPYFRHQQQKQALRQTRRRVQEAFIEGDRLLVFVARDCPDCRKALGRLVDTLDDVPGSRIDLYVLGVPDNTAVRQWAARYRLPPQWQDQERLTLNRDDGLYRRLDPQAPTADPPHISLFLHRAGRFFRLDSAVYSL